MFPCHGFLGYFAAAGCICGGFSWLYWLREIGRDVNKTLPIDQRMEWGITERLPFGRMHWFWSEHNKLFPESRKRAYAAISFLASFLIPIAALLACILIGGWA
jgi:hypothetical protein